MRHLAARSLALDAMPSNHLKFAGLQQRTLRAYRQALEGFLEYASRERVSLNSVSQLDVALADYVNGMFQEGDSLAVAGHLLSGVKRFCPNLRLKVPTAAQYFRNWQRIYRPVRATPVSLELIQAMAAIAWKVSRPLAFLLLLGFSAMLRTVEMLTLQYQHLLLHPGRQELTVIIPFAKTSNGNPQIVRCADPSLWVLLEDLKRSHSPRAYAWPSNPRSFHRTWKDLLACLHFDAGDYVPYGIRRGGATEYFLATGNMDATLHRGRWMTPKTAKQYIDHGTLVLAVHTWSRAQRTKVQKWSTKCAQKFTRLRQKAQKSGVLVRFWGSWLVPPPFCFLLGFFWEAIEPFPPKGY